MKVIKFTSSACGPCRMFQPVWLKLKNDIHDDSIEFEEHIIDQEQNIMPLLKQFNIHAVPTILISDNAISQSYQTLRGMQTYEQVVSAIKDSLKQELGNG